jgi:D-tagatose-1,6-bisphosphate aldolase subunit GatZ/KbaZ
MVEAETMIAAYAEAGFTKLHLDTSMGCRGEPVALDDTTTATRAARLAARAETAQTAEPPVYIIGTEVPVPGGATHNLDHLEVTRPEAALRTLEVHREAFSALGLSNAFARVIGLVVQPGVEFGNDSVIAYDRAAARALVESLGQMPGLVFEAHSTDYQSGAALAALVEDGFAILKVGPGLTFSLRQALYGLDHIAVAMGWISEDESLRATMERLMLEKPGDWQRYYSSDPKEAHVQRHFSYSDRIRYYWPNAAADAAVQRLLALFGDAVIPPPLQSQYLGNLDDEDTGLTARQLVLKAVRKSLDPYSRAIGWKVGSAA